jgi:hypothetical protein
MQRASVAIGIVLGIVLVGPTSGCSDDDGDQPDDLQNIDRPAQVDPDFVPGGGSTDRSQTGG